MGQLLQTGEKFYFIDDIFFIWEHGEESLKVFKEQVNTFYPTVKFTAEYSKDKRNFLDVNIKLIDGEICRFVC